MPCSLQRYVSSPGEETEIRRGDGSPEEVRFAPGSPLEGDAFEPSVPRRATLLDRSRLHAPCGHYRGPLSVRHLASHRASAEPARRRPRRRWGASNDLPVAAPHYRGERQAGFGLRHPAAGQHFIMSNDLHFRRSTHGVAGQHISGHGHAIFDLAGLLLVLRARLGLRPPRAFFDRRGRASGLGVRFWAC
jgi:hypothetical protein